MDTPRISASSYSNTAPLIWSFLYGRERGNVELIMDNAPARSAELLSQGRVDAALVPVFAYQSIDGARLIPDVCVGAKEKVRSVCLVTRGGELASSRKVALDTSSRTSAGLTQIIFREFLAVEPEWQASPPNIDQMLDYADAALIIGDPALALSADPAYRTFDLVELWRSFTGLGFIFAMWMTVRENVVIDFAGARDEGLAHSSEIAVNYADQIGLSVQEMQTYLTRDITYTPDDSMTEGMALYFRLAEKHGLIQANQPLLFANS